MNSILTVNSITKHYGPVRALNQVTLEVPQGSVFGILGPNGSGKTTLLGILMDVLKATSGTYSWFGEPPSELQRRRIGTLLETPNFYHYLSGEGNLRIAASIKGRGEEDIERVLRLVKLYDRRHSKFSTYSLGMKQRLAIAACLLGDPAVLVFDEPTNGLDPVGIAEIREMITELSRAGKTILLASHLLVEVEKVCTHVAIILRGDLLTAGRVDEVLSNEEFAEVGAADMPRLKDVLQRFPGVKGINENSHFLNISFESGHADMAALNHYCFDQGIVLTHLQLTKRSLESKFIELTS